MARRPWWVKWRRPGANPGRSVVVAQFYRMRRARSKNGAGGHFWDLAASADVVK
jgi:hypothetical protein